MVRGTSDPDRIVGKAEAMAEVALGPAKPGNRRSGFRRIELTDLPGET
jgi:hypothetical protein